MKAAPTPKQGPGGDNPKGSGPSGKTRRAPIAPVLVRPMARAARRKRRHTFVLLSFLILVLAPVAGVTWYINARAVDQFASTAGFTVRQEDDSAPMAALSGLAQFAGAPSIAGALDADILYEFIQSQSLVSRINADLDLRGHFTGPHDQDPVFALTPGGTIEDLYRYWGRVVQIDYDSTTGLIGLEVRAFDSGFAKTIAERILEESQTLVNDLNAQARSDMLRSAEQDVTASLERLRAARQALVTFRTRTQIVDPESDIQTRMGVQNSLQQQLAQALIDHDLLAHSARADDSRLVQARLRIDAIRDRLAEERSSFSSGESYDGVESYPNLIAEYESLAVDREFAEETYRGALAQKELAVANVTRKTRYLATYVRPTMAETALYPQRVQVVFMTLLFSLLFWALVTLVYYSVRDRS